MQEEDARAEVRDCSVPQRVRETEIENNRDSDRLRVRQRMRQREPQRKRRSERRREASRPIHRDSEAVHK